MTPLPEKSMLISRLVRCVLLCCIFFALTGCNSYLVNFYFGDLFGGGGSETEKNAEQLAFDGIQNMKDKDYGDAVKDFQQLKERYPYSKYAILAELKLGDAYFFDKKYADAAIAYEEFVRLHPRNEVVPYVLYQIGMCHFLSFSTVDRDQEETRLAMEGFQRVMQAYPDSEYARRAKKQLFECQKRIVAHEYYVGEFYYKQEKYTPALDRLEKIAQNYPQAVMDLGYEDQVKSMLAECQKHVEQDGEAKPSIWTRLGF
jgi:outer membrane protein assembly factor BamD